MDQQSTEVSQPEPLSFDALIILSLCFAPNDPFWLVIQAAQLEATNKRLLKKVAEAQGERSLATSLLNAFHLKVAHLEGVNAGLQVKLADLQRKSEASRQACIVTLTDLTCGFVPNVLRCTMGDLPTLEA